LRCRAASSKGVGVRACRSQFRPRQGVGLPPYGKRRYVTAEAHTRPDAETELANLLADVRRGIWRAPESGPVVEEPKAEPTFHEFSSEWLAAREQEGLAEKTIADLRWSLTNHLLPHFANFSLSEIDPMAVDRYKVGKAQERQEYDQARERGEKAPRGLSNNSINHTLSDLAQVLETAVEYGLLAQNPASGKRRRLKSTRPNRPWVEPQQLPALLDSAKTGNRAGIGRVLLGLLAGTGLRIGEALDLRWRHVDLATGTLHVGKAKTEAGVRSVDLTSALREELVLWRAESLFTGADDHVLTTSTGGKHSDSNLRRDVLKPAVEAANIELAKDGIAELDGITFHSFRRTYASLRGVCGDDVRYTATQIGHTDARFTLSVYAQAITRRERLSGPHLRAYDRAIEWARMGTIEGDESIEVPTEATKSPV